MALREALTASIGSPSPGQVFLAVIVGVLAGSVGVTTSLLSPKLAVLLAGAVPLAALCTLKPRIGVLLTIFAICLIDEFPGGIGDTNTGGDEFQRSERTPFYGKSLGIPAFYLPDALILGLLGLYLLKAIIWRKRYPVELDRISVALILLAVTTVLSIVVPLSGTFPFGPPNLDLSTMGSITLQSDKVRDIARYVPILQYKLFLLLFPSYLLGLYFLREKRDLDHTIMVFGAAMVGAILIATARLASNPGMIRHLVPVVFDTGAVAFMAVAVFYCISNWSCGAYDRRWTVIQVVFCALLIVFILTSFRRTMWGAIAVATLILPFLLPRRALPRFSLLVSIGMIMAALVLGGTPPGHAILVSIIDRLSETNSSNASTLYRLAIGIWMAQHIWSAPFFGHGLEPMWNEVIRIRFFVANLENVHSLYIWVLIRMGILGLLTGVTCMYLIGARLRAVYREMDQDRYRVLVIVIFLSIVMLLFNGLFNPVYANVRHIVPLGFMLAMASRLPALVGRRRATGPVLGGGNGRPGDPPEQVDDGL